MFQAKHKNLLNLLMSQCKNHACTGCIFLFKCYGQYYFFDETWNYDCCNLLQIILNIVDLVIFTTKYNLCKMVYFCFYYMSFGQLVAYFDPTCLMGDLYDVLIILLQCALLHSWYDNVSERTYYLSTCLSAWRKYVSCVYEFH